METSVERSVKAVDGPGAGTAVPVDELTARAAELFGRGDLQGALGVLRQAVAIEPDRIELRLFLGNVLYHARDAEGAQLQFARAVELNPNNLVARTSLAAALLSLGESSEAERSVREALRLSPEDSESLKCLGGLCLQAGRFREGADAYGRMLRKHSGDIDALLAQGRCFFDLGELSKASRNFSRVLALQPGHPLAVDNLEVVRRRARTLGERLPDTRETIRAEFESIGPWYTQFTLGSEVYGGTHSYANDPRMKDFRQWHQSGGRVLELGSFEGAHSLALAALPAVTEVVGLEARPELIARANLVKRLSQATHVSFFQCDVEKDPTSHLGRFDVVFCAGLLYYVREPWRLIERLSSLTDRLFLSTHYAVAGEESRLHYEGRRYAPKPTSGPRGGVAPVSFWPTFKSLVTMLTEHGFAVKRMRDYPEWDNTPLVNLYCEK